MNEVEELRAKNAELEQAIGTIRSVGLLPKDMLPADIAEHMRSVADGWMATERELRERIESLDAMLAKAGEVASSWAESDSECLAALKEARDRIHQLEVDLAEAKRQLDFQNERVADLEKNLELRKGLLDRVCDATGENLWMDAVGAIENVKKSGRVRLDKLSAIFGLRPDSGLDRIIEEAEEAVKQAKDARSHKYQLEQKSREFDAMRADLRRGRRVLNALPGVVAEMMKGHVGHIDDLLGETEDIPF